MLTGLPGTGGIRATSPLDLLLLTKRPENIMDMVPAHWRTAWPSYVWIGATAESRATFAERVAHLRKVPAAVRFHVQRAGLVRDDRGDDGAVR